MRFLSCLLTINVGGDVAKYDEVGLVYGPPENPLQSTVVVDQDTLLGYAVSHHPDTQQEHEEEHVHHLERNMMLVSCFVIIAIWNVSYLDLPTILLTMMILGPSVRLMLKMAMRRKQKTTKSMQRMILPA